MIKVKNETQKTKDKLEITPKPLRNKIPGSDPVGVYLGKGIPIRKDKGCTIYKLNPEEIKKKYGHHKGRNHI